MLAGVFLVGMPAYAELTKPAWLTDCSVGIKEGYDNNIFLSGVNPGNLPSTYTVPAGSVAALKNEYSWVTTISPKVGVNFSPLVGQTNLTLLSLAYAPDIAIYHNQTSESYEAHRVFAAAKAKTDDVSFSGDNSFTYIDGSDKGPVYPGGLYSAFATMADRERREQIQDRANASMQFDAEKWFFRPTASLLYYDLMTKQINLTGYQNYCEPLRREWWRGCRLQTHTATGVDAGLSLRPPISAAVCLFPLQLIERLPTRIGRCRR